MGSKAVNDALNIKYASLFFVCLSAFYQDIIAKRKV